MRSGRRFSGSLSNIVGVTVPPVTAELRHRGMPVNHKRVVRIMGEDNLLAVQPRRFVSEHECNTRRIYLNLARPHDADRD